MSTTPSTSAPLTSSSSTPISDSTRSPADQAKYQEVERILKAFKLNPYDILDLPTTATEAEIKRQYRKKSLMIHPDKFKHERGEEAFDHLKKAEAQLSEASKRAEIDAIMTHARTLVLKSVLGDSYAPGIENTDPRLVDLKPSFEWRIRAKAKEVLIEDELAKRNRTKIAFANEGAEKARIDAEREARKRKAEEQAKWEERREERVTGWREFSKKPKKSKKNAHVLG